MSRKQCNNPTCKFRGTCVKYFCKGGNASGVGVCACGCLETSHAWRADNFELTEQNRHEFDATPSAAGNAKAASTAKTASQAKNSEATEIKVEDKSSEHKLDLFTGTKRKNVDIKALLDLGKKKAKKEKEEKDMSTKGNFFDFTVDQSGSDDEISGPTPSAVPVCLWTQSQSPVPASPLCDPPLASCASTSKPSVPFSTSSNSSTGQHRYEALPAAMQDRLSSLVVINIAPTMVKSSHWDEPRSRIDSAAAALMEGAPDLCWGTDADNPGVALFSRKGKLVNVLVGKLPEIMRHQSRYCLSCCKNLPEGDKFWCRICNRWVFYGCSSFPDNLGPSETFELCTNGRLCCSCSAVNVVDTMSGPY